MILQVVMVSFGILLCATSGACEAVMDKIRFHFNDSIFSEPKYNQNFWNPKLADNNKWKNGDKSQGERFFLSSTLLVWWTDAWHRFKFIMHTTLFVGLPIVVYFTEKGYLAVSLCLLSRILFGITFTLFFDKWLSKV